MERKNMLTQFKLYRLNVHHEKSRKSSLKPRYTKQIHPQDKRKSVQERAKHTDRTWEKRLKETEVKITVNVIATF